MHNSTGSINFASFPSLSSWFSTISLAVKWSVWYQNVPLVIGKLVGRFIIKFKDDRGSLEQDFSNQSILAESQYLGLTKTFTVGFKHLGFQKFQCLDISTFNGEAVEV